MTTAMQPAATVAAVAPHGARCSYKRSSPRSLLSSFSLCTPLPHHVPTAQFTAPLQFTTCLLLMCRCDRSLLWAEVAVRARLRYTMRIVTASVNIVRKVCPIEGKTSDCDVACTVRTEPSRRFHFSGNAKPLAATVSSTNSRRGG